MKIYPSLESAPTPARGCVLSVGNFDGVHRGHQVILEQAHALAQSENLPLLVLTFDPSPVSLLYPAKAPKLITPGLVKSALLRQMKIDQLIIANTTRQLLDLSPEEFIKTILVDKLRVRHIVEGQTFNFGKRREGSALSLQELGAKYGLTAHMTPSQCVTLANGTTTAVSSTLIRQQVLMAEFLDARLSLGRWFSVFGSITPGRRIGRRLGFPTANLKLLDENQLVPEDGVYAAYAAVADQFDQLWKSPLRYYPAAAVIGPSRSFKNSPWQMEAHLLDFFCPPDELYDTFIQVIPVARIRQQQNFAAEAELIQAIQNDLQRIRQILQTIPLEF